MDRLPPTPADAAYAVDPALARRLLRHLVVGPGAGTGSDVRALRRSPAATVSEPGRRLEWAFARARRAQQAWAQTASGRTGPSCCLRLHDLVLDRQDEIMDLICWESGKARKHAFDELTSRSPRWYYARTAHQHLDPGRRVGVVPGADPGRGEPGAQGRRRDHRAVELPRSTSRSATGSRRRLAGNAVVTKPDAQTMLTALSARSCCEEAGFPDGALERRGRPGAGARARRSSSARRLRLLHRLDPRGAS